MDVKNELNFGFTLKRIRKEKKLSQEELAFKSNISERTIRNIENSKTSISYNTLVSLSNALEVDLFKYYIDKNLKFYKLHNKIFYAVLKKIIGSNFDLNIEIKEIEYLKSIISNEYESKIYLRLKFFVEAIKSLFNDDVFKSKALLEKSICTTKSEFNDNYNLNYFNEFEIFIFLFLILVKQKLRIKMDFEKLYNSTQFIKPNSLEYILKRLYCQIAMKMHKII
ncbi:MAG: helix-turn-helix transcriptional regulator [Tissierellia bacterium]|nr:helix-turn-helix transcriptional regulator [Tissierellia bacterium]